VNSVKKKDFEGALRHLTDLVKNNPEAEWPFIANPDSTVWVNSPVDKRVFNKDLSYRDWYKGISREWNPYISSVFKMVVGEQDLAVAVSAPIFDEKGKVIGILSTAQSVAFFWKIIGEVSSNADANTTLIDQEGHIICSNRFPYAKEVIDYPSFDLVKRTTKGEKGNVEVQDSSDGDRVKYVSFAPIEGIGWSIIVEKGKSEVFRSKYSFLVLIAAISFLMYAIVVLSFVYLRGRERQIEELEKLNKELDGRVRERTAELEAANQELKEEITERQQAEEALQFMRFSVDHAVDTIVCVNHDARFIEVNDVFCRSVGYSREELLLMTVHDIDPDYSAEIWPEFWEKMKQIGSLTFESCHRTKEGKVFPVEITASFLEYNGKEYHCSFARDITERKKAEQALSDSEQRYRNLVENAPDVIYTVAPDGTITSISPAFESITGWTRSEWLHRQFMTILHPDDLSRGLELFQRVLKGEKTAPFELRILRKSGDYLTAEFTVTPQIKNGSVIYILGIGRDVTKRKNTEKALKEREDLNRDLVEYSQCLISTHDLEGQILSVNQEGARLLGYDQKDLLDRNIRDLLAPTVTDEFDSYLSAIREKGAAKGFMRIQNAKGEKRIWAYSNSLRTEGVTKPIVRSIAHDITEPLRTEKEVKRLSQENAAMAEIGRVINSTLNINDVYNRFAEMVRELIGFDRITVLIANLRDNSARTAYFTGLDVPFRTKTGILALTGIFKEKVIRTREIMLIHIEDQEKVNNEFPELLPNFQAGIRSLIAIPLISKDEVIGVLNLQSCKPDAYSEKDLKLAERVGNQIAGAIANAQLYSERKQAEEALKKNQEELIQKNQEIEESRKTVQLALVELEGAYKELKTSQAKILQQEKMASIGQLAAGVAHEINNPMAFISSNLGTLDKYVRRLIEFIQTQSEVIASLQTTEAMEGLNRKQKELKLDYIIEDIKGVIAESLEGSDRVQKIVQGLKSFARGDEAEYKYANINDCIESTVNIVWNELKYKATLKKDYGNLPLTKCYPQQMNQVFANLLINAVHSIEKQGEITIKTWDEDGSIKIAISDTGGGIPQEYLNKIFEPFFTTKEVGKGTGLGLSITYEIVKKHNGEITVESEVGKGTIFTIRLPIVLGNSMDEGIRSL
jgi:PAS domain S-box-containing protein